METPVREGEIMTRERGKRAKPAPLARLFDRWFSRTRERDEGSPSPFASFKAGFQAGRRYQRRNGD